MHGVPHQILMMGSWLKVVFDDKSASTTLTVGEFNQCRAAYIAVHPYDRSISEEAKERRENERRERGVGRGGREVRGGRGGRSIGRGAIDPVRQNPPQLAEVPFLPPTNQLAVQASLAQEEQAAIVAHTIRVVGEGPHPQTGKRKRREVFGNEEICMCSCMKIYDTTDMSNCKGMNCSNRIRRSCVPLNWLCNICNEI